ncbi:hypothetical protein BGX31_010111 [Mortierella sp. GBA43]|nr:hypothetical protein BGX31_010111 [Mortierella sp. GBA43]
MAKSIEKMGPDEILTISKKLFYGGFCLLPFLWLYNVLYLWPVRNRNDLSPQVHRSQDSEQGHGYLKPVATADVSGCFKSLD